MDELAKEKGLQDVIIQSDAIVVVECFRGSNFVASIHFGKGYGGRPL